MTINALSEILNSTYTAEIITFHSRRLKADILLTEYSFPARKFVDYWWDWMTDNKLVDDIISYKYAGAIILAMVDDDNTPLYHDGIECNDKTYNDYYDVAVTFARQMGLQELNEMFKIVDRLNIITAKAETESAKLFDEAETNDS